MTSSQSSSASRTHTDLARQQDGCAFCLDAHTLDAIAEGATVKKPILVSAWREAGACVTARERAALEWTEVVTSVAGSQVPDEAFFAAKEPFPDMELADLTLAIGLINAYALHLLPSRSFSSSPSGLSAAYL